MGGGRNLLSPGKRREGRRYQKEKGKIKRTGIQTELTKIREGGQNRAAWSLQVTPSNLHPTSVQQGSESPPPCASFFSAPRRGGLLCRRQTDGSAIACAPVGDFSRWGVGSFFVLLQPSSPAALECSGPPPVCVPVSYATQTCAHMHLGTVKISAEPVRKIAVFISRVFFIFEKYLC